ncbi:MAG: NAD(P)-dependent oxidoreductase [Candidatus Methylacidiphilales bacterium]|nr:NAD(P)-binding domain-containing protein [Candidatus Methylacidiphilales bacterium]
MPAVSIIGLGSMGSTLARLTLQHCAAATIWNRTASKAEALAGQGASIARDVAAAVAGGDIIVVCVQDIAGGQTLLEDSAVTDHLSGRVIVHLSTGNAQDARDAQSWAKRHGALLLAGAIQAAPAQMGRPDTTVLVSGDEEAWRRSESVLRILGGNIVYLGSDAGAAPTMDLATLSYVYGTFIGFIHGARVAEAAGIDLQEYGRIIGQISPAFGDFLRHEANVIHSGDFSITESPMGISIEATERLAVTARAAGINDEFPAFATSLFRRAGDAGLAREEAAALIKILR